MLFIGSGAQTSQPLRQVAQHGLRSFTFKPYQPREQLAQSLSVADVHLVSLRPSLEGLIVPSKYQGIAAATRRPIFIGDQDGEIARILASSGGGFSVYEGDATALGKTVLELVQQPQQAQRMGRNAHSCFDEHFDMERAVARWQDILARAGVPAPQESLVSQYGRAARVASEGA